MCCLGAFLCSSFYFQVWVNTKCLHFLIWKPFMMVNGSSYVYECSCLWTKICVFWLYDKVFSFFSCPGPSELFQWLWTIQESHSDPLRFSGREKRKGPMISAGDAEFPRDYHTLAAGGGRGARRFTDSTNGGFTAASLDRRHNSVAAKSLEALNSIHKADIERQRDALMDLQKNKFSNSPGSLSQGSAPAGRQVETHTHTNTGWVQGDTSRMSASRAIMSPLLTNKVK